jgi:hypothetical protein
MFDFPRQPSERSGLALCFEAVTAFMSEIDPAATGAEAAA